MKVLYVAPKYDYGDSARGLSYEHYNFYDTLVNLGHDLIYVDSLAPHGDHGDPKRLGDTLRTLVHEQRPDLMFCCLFRDEIDYGSIAWISRRTETVTFNWFTDDHWFFDQFSYRWAHAFNWVSTTAESALSKYRGIGYSNVIKTQWACNHFLYKPLQAEPRYDVSFVGQPHGNRRDVIHRLRRSGIKVDVWGHGWESGRLSQEEMSGVFASSRINLNLSNSSVVGRRSSWRVRLAGRHESAPSQIKGRVFEVPGCGGFLLTDVAENLAEYYEPGCEIETFRSDDDLVDKIRYYVRNETERRAIAAAGHNRTLREHTFGHRFCDLFERMGLSQAAQVPVTPARGR